MFENPILLKIKIRKQNASVEKSKMLTKWLIIRRDYSEKSGGGGHSSKLGRHSFEFGGGGILPSICSFNMLAICSFNMLAIDFIFFANTGHCKSIWLFRQDH